MVGSQRTPPRFVPTLTAVIEDDADAVAPAIARAEPVSPAPLAQVALPPNLEVDSLGLEEQLLHRVLRRLDLSLEERLTDTVSAAVQQQLDLMLPRLRTEIEQLLRALVLEALAVELSQPPSAPPSAAETFG